MLTNFYHEALNYIHPSISIYISTNHFIQSHDTRVVVGAALLLTYNGYNICSNAIKVFFYWKTGSFYGITIKQSTQWWCWLTFICHWTCVCVVELVLLFDSISQVLLPIHANMLTSLLNDNPRVATNKVTTVKLIEQQYAIIKTESFLLLLQLYTVYTI
jgi:hypothetical protein